MRSVVAALVVVCEALVMQTSAMAQSWEVEVHGGALSTSDISGGTSSLPAPGETFITTPPFSSRRVSSWLIGDGAQLLNAIIAAPAFGVQQRLTPLDSVANNRLANRNGGGSVGFRVSRELTTRFAAEFNFDYANTPFEERSGVQSGLDATTSTFRVIFENPIFLPTVLFVGKAVTASNTLAIEDGNEIVASGAVRFTILTSGMIRPYVTGGAGVTRHGGHFTVATADAGYSFNALGVFPFNERDRVRLTQTFDESVFVGVVGGGAHLHLWSSSGLRVEVRAHIGSSTEQVLLDATPSVTVGNPAFQIFSATNPSISFNSFPQPSAFPPSSLSGAAIDEFSTFEASGARTQVTWSVGYFFRF
jgi:hypothetical protein